MKSNNALRKISLRGKILDSKGSLNVENRESENLLRVLAPVPCFGASLLASSFPWRSAAFCLDPGAVVRRKLGALERRPRDYSRTSTTARVSEEEPLYAACRRRASLDPAVKGCQACYPLAPGGVL